MSCYMFKGSKFELAICCHVCWVCVIFFAQLAIVSATLHWACKGV
jgi:hypothetical protein